jgi:hypothetical protein
MNKLLLTRYFVLEFPRARQYLRGTKDNHAKYSHQRRKSPILRYLLLIPHRFSGKVRRLFHWKKMAGGTTRFEKPLLLLCIVLLYPLVSHVNKYYTLSCNDDKRKSMTSSRLSGISMSSFLLSTGISIMPIRCIILTRNFRASALDWITSDSVRRRMCIDSGMIDRPMTRSE